MSNKPQFLTALTRLWRLDIFVIVLVVVVLDLVARTSSLPVFHIGWNQFDVPYRSRIWWANRDFQTLKKAPDVVLLGPSTITCAMYGAEAKYTHRAQCELLKHSSDYLEHQLKELAGYGVSTFCLGLPGQVPSDAFMITKGLLVGDRVPKAVFYGITARDFIDATFNDPSDTDTFKMMSNIGHFPELQYSCRNSIWEKLNYQLGKISFIYGHKPFLVSAQHHFVHDALANLDGGKFVAAEAPDLIRKQAMIQLPEDLSGLEVQDVYDPSKQACVDNLAEYRTRYASFRPKRFEQQLGFFKAVVDYCRQQNIKLYVANMPITRANRNLVPPAVFALYQSRTSEIARSGGAQYVDFDNPKDFVASDFMDSVHLNGTGGQKVLDRIASLIVQGSQVASTARAGQVPY